MLSSLSSPLSRSHVFYGFVHLLLDMLLGETVWL